MSLSTNNNGIKTILEDEHEIIKRSRKQNGRKGSADIDSFVGLAFSGGGIRSATFNLGVIKALANLGLLKHVDYLSTVSGGGYIGSWLMAYLWHHFDPNSTETVDDVIKRACASSDRHSKDNPIWFLRSYSNYLTPKMGMFSLDTWAVLSTYLRNWLLNLTLLFFFLTTFLLVFHIIEVDGILFVQHFKAYRNLGLWVTGFAFTAALCCVVIALDKPEKTADVDTADTPIRRDWYPQIGLILIIIGAFLGSFYVLSYAASESSQIATFLSAIPIAHAVIWTPPIIILVAMLFAVFYIGIVSKSQRLMNSRKLEWLARFAASLLILITGWIVIFALIFYSPLLVRYLGKWSTELSFAWILQSGVGLFLANSSQISAKEGAKSHQLIGYFIKFSPYLFIFGIFIFISYVLVSLLYGSCPEDHFQCLNHSVDNGVALYVLIATLSCGLVTYIFGRLLDVNKLSIHHFYRNRLIRCYLGAARNNDNDKTRRIPHEFTGFDENDNLPLANLLLKEGDHNFVHGPYPIINGTLNLVGGKELAWQQRKGASFIFTPQYCGYELDDQVCYETTESYFKVGKLSLGSAMAISGAAASPNRGFHSSPEMSFLMTFFNVRLGQWLPNTNIPIDKQQKRITPQFSLYYLLRELLGKTDIQDEFVYLSDGGHFENLGIYELVRRGCQFILACDAEQDEKYIFEGLGNAVEKCRVDLGVNIEIDVESLKPNALNNLVRQHFAVGTIKYSENTGGGYPKEDGILLYLKATVTGDEPIDILHYALDNPQFPQESTADQWFNELQFESYRKLGEHICQHIFKDIHAPDSIEKIFQQVKKMAVSATN